MCVCILAALAVAWKTIHDQMEMVMDCSEASICAMAMGEAVTVGKAEAKAVGVGKAEAVAMGKADWF